MTLRQVIRRAITGDPQKVQKVLKREKVTKRACFTLGRGESDGFTLFYPLSKDPGIPTLYPLGYPQKVTLTAPTVCTVCVVQGWYRAGCTQGGIPRVVYTLPVHPGGIPRVVYALPVHPVGYPGWYIPSLYTRWDTLWWYISFLYTRWDTLW